MDERIYAFDFSQTDETARELMLEEIRVRERRFAVIYAHKTDDELCAYLRSIAQELGRTPRKREVVGFQYIKSRLGPWPRALEKAELKEPNPYRKAAKDKRIKRKRRTQQHANTKLQISRNYSRER